MTLLRQLLLIAALVSPFLSIGQPTPLILKGRLDNCPEKELYIYFNNSPLHQAKDTIYINASGDFYFKTFKCEGPQKISIINNSTQINHLLVAPGFEMNITGDATNSEMLNQTLVFSGTGACVNRYKEKLKELAFEGKDIPVVYEIDPALTNTINYRDSLINAVFDNCTDPYSAWFKKLEQYETAFGNYSRILDRAIWANYDNDTYFSFINKNIPDTILADPGKNAEWLISENYRFFLYSYKNYLLQLANRKDSNIIKNDKDYLLKRISNVFNGEIREYIFYTGYTNAIGSSNNLEELEKVHKKYEPFIDSNIAASQKIILQKKYADKYSFFQSTEKGMPAPGFSFPDRNGIKHNLSDFLGKVVYIDFWASWCGPCRAETGPLKELYQKYKDNKNLVIIGVTSSDGKANWLRALDEDKPGWLQLRDENGETLVKYNTNTIPRFVIIDKKGMIVTIDAPRPSEKKDLLPIIENEIRK